MSGNNPYAKFAQPQSANPYARFSQPSAPKPEPAPSGDFRTGIVPQLAIGATEGIASLPGLPVDAIVGGGNFIRRQFDIPETKLEDTPLKDWGGQGWRDANLSRLDALTGQTHDIPNPQGGVATFARKTGNFVGGALPLGPSAMIPAVTAAIGSEGGKKLDEAAPEFTKGYGEFAGSLLAPTALAAGESFLRPKSVGPSVADLRAESKAAYDAADQAGVVYNANGLQRLGSTIDNDLADMAYHPDTEPKVKAFLQVFNDQAQGNVTLSGLDKLRKFAAKAAASTDRTEAAMGSQIVSHIDDFIDNAAPHEVLMGDAQGAANSISTARDAWGRMRRAETLDELFNNAELQSSATGSGGNVENAMRQKIKGLLVNKKALRGFSDADKAALRKVVTGSGPIHSLLRVAGKLSPQGNGLMAALGWGSTAGLGPFGWVPSAVGLVAKPLSESMTKRNLTRASNLVRSGGAKPPAPNMRRMLTRGPNAVAQAMLPGTPGAVQSR